VLQHVSDHRESIIVQCLAKNYKNDSIVSVDMDKVGVMAAYSDPLCVRVCCSLYWKAFCACVCSSLYMKAVYEVVSGLQPIACSPDTTPA